MKTFRNLLTTGLLLMAAAAGFGCATTEPENVSERPWNAPKSWEHGIPTGLTNPY